jgi:predicted NAD-dependent protein-ADP-ribosyltransferase YbiA (DUF1768 family)
MSIDDDVLTALDAEAVGQYRRADCAAFRKTGELWGEFSNMAGGFPLAVNGVRILTSEALYQACRFPHLPEVQREIIAQASPMAAKMKGKPHRKNSRPDFDSLRVPVMWWALRVKLACNYRSFSRILRASGDRPIVEDSHKKCLWSERSHRVLATFPATRLYDSTVINYGRIRICDNQSCQIPAWFKPG